MSAADETTRIARDTAQVVGSMGQEAKEAAPEMTAGIGKGIQSAKEKARAAKKRTTETVSETSEKVKRKLKGEE
jgi:ElaB/YqjD/DUF883 family membrane-anchored ribosome-binding protein